MPNDMSLLVKQLRKGSNLRLIFSITTYCITEEVSEQFEIADLAWVRLKCKPDEQSHAIYMSYMKHELSEDTLIRMNVSSKALNYSKQFYCPYEGWTDWVLLGLHETLRFYVDSQSVFSSIVDVSICVSKEKTETYSKCNLCPKLYEDQDFTDFQLTAADGIVAVHKACLAARSNYFKQMFTGKWKETEEGSVDLKGVSRKNLQDLKDFIYLGKLPDSHSLSDLIVLAKRFLMEDLVAECAKKLAETVVPEDLCILNELACQHNIPELTFAIIELTSDEVVHKACQLKMKKDGDSAA